MKKYVVAYISFFDNELVQLIVEAESEYEAIKKGMIELTSEEYRQDEIDFQNDPEYPKTVEEQKQLAFNSDSMVAAIEI
jgi:hypothetical protein